MLATMQFTDPESFEEYLAPVVGEVCVRPLTGSALFSGLPREREVNGLRDPRFRFSINLYGAPALPLQEFPHYQQDLIIGASLQVSPPLLGQYNKNKLVNLAANRWFIKPGIGISKAWGALTLELSESVFLYTDKHDNFGNTTLEQDPLYATQARLTYNIKPGILAAVSVTIENGVEHTSLKPG